MWTGLEIGLQKVLSEHLNLPSPTSIQQSCIEKIAASDRDYIVKAPTGSGKTLAVLAPLLSHALQNHTQRSAGSLILVLAPTRELAIQTNDLLTKILNKIRPHWMTSMLLCGTSNAGDKDGDGPGGAGSSRKKEKEALRKGQTVVVGTPGRVLDHLQNSSGWVRGQLAWVVLDEADRLLDAGFAPKVREIIGLLGQRRPAIVYCSATVSAHASAWVDLRENTLLIDAQVSMPATLRQQALTCPTKHRLAALLSLLAAQPPSARIVVFMSNCDSVDFHYELFKRRLVPECRLRPESVYKLHGSLGLLERRQMLAAFGADAGRAVLFATDVAARGLNMHCGLIVQYDAPADRLDYVHRAGRTARGVEGEGRSILMLMESEADYLALLRDKHSIQVEPLAAGPLLAWLREADDTKKSRFGLWLKKLSENIAKDAAVAALARRAYSSTVRAYATHPSDERHIFHVKRLHLGHLASAFGLTDFEFAKVSARKDEKPDARKRKSDRSDRPAPVMRKRPKLSEFSAY